MLSAHEATSGIPRLFVAFQYNRDMDKQEHVQGGLLAKERRLSGDLFGLLLRKEE